MNLELVSGCARTYHVRVRMPFRSSDRRVKNGGTKWGKVNICFIGGGSDGRAFMYETPVINLNCRQVELHFYGPELDEGVDKVFIRSGGVEVFNEVVVDEVRYIPSWGNPVVFEREREYSAERYEENMRAYRRLKMDSLYGGIAATLIGCGVILGKDGADAVVHSEVFAVGGLFGLMYQFLLHYDIDTIQGNNRLPLALPVRLSLVIGLVSLISKVTDIDPQIFIIGILGFMTNKAGLLWAGTTQAEKP